MAPQPLGQGPVGGHDPGPVAERGVEDRGVSLSDRGERREPSGELGRDPSAGDLSRHEPVELVVNGRGDPKGCPRADPVDLGLEGKPRADGQEEGVRVEENRGPPATGGRAAMDA
jgi:hypothetical protein